MLRFVKKNKTIIKGQIMTEERNGFYFELLELLEQDPEKRFYADNGKDLLRNKVYECAMKMDKDLIKLLLSNDRMKDKFFTDIDGTLVFDKTAFGWAVNNKAFLQDSYTRFKNTIGLIDSKEQFISSKNDVVLSFPYKDCVLEGGQTKEDQKRGEIFYNELLAPDDVDRLLAPKVFTNMKRYTKDGEENIFSFLDSDNLLIKGNNLLSLSSIKQRYRGKVKCIYADIPYNTGSDSFNYNDDFSRSTWLVFMKNRINELKDFLADDGVMLVQCSFHQYAYLKILMDEIIGHKNYKMTINIQVRHQSRILTGDKEYNDIIEYILLYSKDPEYKIPKIKEEKLIDDYVYSIKEKAPGQKVKMGDKDVFIFLPSEYEVVKNKANKQNFKTLSIRGSIREKNSSGRFYVKYLEQLTSKYPPETLFKVSDMGDDMYDYRYFALPKEHLKNGIYYQGMPTSSSTTYKPYPNFFNFVDEYNMVNYEGEVEFRNGKKPEELIRHLLEIFTEKGDYVLDSFVGSGTTCAVAQKLERKFIGIEQMDYVQSITLERLKQVINGEKSGISKSVNWQGGGSFVYCELKELNQRYIDEIQVADDNKLNDLYKEITNSEFISYKADINKLKESEQDFKEISTEDKRNFLIQVLDKNLLYVNYCDMEDEDLAVTEEEKAFARSFYSEGV